MKMLYKYPQNAFPYDDLIKTNAERSKDEPEYELIDTGILESNEYFDIFIEYAKESQSDILIRLTVVNKADKEAELIILPTVWFRNTWNWGYDDYKPWLSAEEANHIRINHKDLEVKTCMPSNLQNPCFVIMKPITEGFISLPMWQDTVRMVLMTLY